MSSDVRASATVRTIGSLAEERRSSTAVSSTIIGSDGQAREVRYWKGAFPAIRAPRLPSRGSVLPGVAPAHRSSRITMSKSLFPARLALRARTPASLVAAIVVSLFSADRPACAQTAQAPTAKALTQYNHEVWLTHRGLPSNGVNALIQTRDGYLWLGTEAGLVRFDGVKFTTFDRNSVPVLRATDVRALRRGSGGEPLDWDRRGVRHPIRATVSSRTSRRTAFVAPCPRSTRIVRAGCGSRAATKWRASMVKPSSRCQQCRDRSRRSVKIRTGRSGSGRRAPKCGSTAVG